MRALSMGDTCVLDERQMTHGVIPVKQSSLPGIIRLPRRYEKNSVNVPVYSNHPRVSEQVSPLAEDENLSERMSDLMLATLWIKQELILLRQHDILLKRQFFNIHQSISSLQPNKNLSKTASLAPSSAAAAQPFALTTNFGLTNEAEITDSTALDSSQLSNQQDTEVLQAQSSCLVTKLGSNLETMLVRPVTYTNACSDYSDDDSDGGDAFFETKFYRPRATSMRTSRDLAASARRRGSKDLI